MAIKIQVLGTGCTKCADLAKNAESAAKAAGVEYELEKVTDVQQIMGFGVLSTPALMVDGKVVSSGKLLSSAEIALFLKPAGGAPASACCSSGCCCSPATEAKPAAKAACDCDCTSKGGSQPCSCAPAAGGTGNGCCCSGGGRGSSLRLWLFPLIALAVAGVLLFKEKNKPVEPTTKPAMAAVGVRSTGELRAVKALPRLVEFGDGDAFSLTTELRGGYAGKLEVEAVNVNTDTEKAKACSIKSVPTQVWLDASGKELFRHEGVMEAGKIVAKFKELGIDLGAP